MGFEYWLPTRKDENGIERGGKKNTENQAVIIIGANGSGKSRLGAWMENNHPDMVHRIGAQRSLTFGSNIQLRNSEQADRFLLYGTPHKTSDHNNRWGQEKDDSAIAYTTGLLNDFEHVLSALIAKYNKQKDEYINECKNKEIENCDHNKVPEFIIDKFKKIWNNFFPHCKISFDDAKVRVKIQKDNLVKEYAGHKMSDGERVALYLISQALCIPENKIIIIDEPEIHLHRSIMNKLWSAIEAERKDCLFIYITHDTQFAANHVASDKIWVRSYDGEKWEFEELPEPHLPEELLLTILGNRKNIIFVEGELGSNDFKLYSELYKNYYVIPCGSCLKVIEFTKSIKTIKDRRPELYHFEAYGIIDLDFRTETEIITLKEKGVHTLDVAEIENLFIVPELLDIIEKYKIITSEEKGKAVEIIKNIYLK